MNAVHQGDMPPMDTNPSPGWFASSGEGYWSSKWGSGAKVPSPGEPATVRA